MGIYNVVCTARIATFKCFTQMGTTCEFTGFNNLDSYAISILKDSSDRQISCREIKTCGWGRDRTVDLTIFSRTLVPTELPSRKQLDKK